MKAEGGGDSWRAELGGTLRMFTARRMAMLSVICWYTGYSQAYQLSVFTRFFDKAGTGLESCVYYSGNILAALAVGRVLDWQHLGSKRRRALVAISMSAATAVPAFALTYGFEQPYVHTVAWDAAAEKYVDGAVGRPIFDPANALPTLALFLWGCGNSVIQCYFMWLIGSVYDGKRLARATGFFKFVQSAGYSLGFALTPMNRCSPMRQLVGNYVCFMLGTLLSLFELPGEGKDEEEGVKGGAGEGTGLLAGSA